MYTNPNFRSKKALLTALTTGSPVSVWSPGPFPAVTDGEEFIEGPHYPEPHRWYAKVLVRGGRIVKVIG